MGMPIPNARQAQGQASDFTPKLNLHADVD